MFIKSVALQSTSSLHPRLILYRKRLHIYRPVFVLLERTVWLETKTSRQWYHSHTKDVSLYRSAQITNVYSARRGGGVDRRGRGFFNNIARCKLPRTSPANSKFDFSYGLCPSNQISSFLIFGTVSCDFKASFHCPTQSYILIEVVIKNACKGMLRVLQKPVFTCDYTPLVTGSLHREASICPSWECVVLWTSLYAYS